jgi:hypothetical protein
MEGKVTAFYFACSGGNAQVQSHCGQDVLVH